MHFVAWLLLLIGSTNAATVLFSLGPVAADFGPRAAVNARCVANKPAHLSYCSRIFAFVLFPGESLQRMRIPTAEEVVSSNGSFIARDWNDSVLAANFFPAFRGKFWSGMRSSGAALERGTCAGWTITNSNAKAGVGLVTPGSSGGSCADLNQLLCVCTASSSTFKPSSSPSRTPSKIPSKAPSKVPSKVPSRMPSHTPGTSVPSQTPTRLPLKSMPLLTSYRIVAGPNHTCVYTGNDIECFGRNNNFQASNQMVAGLTDLATGRDMTCFRTVTSSNTITCYGKQNGRDANSQFTTCPVGFSVSPPPATGVPVIITTPGGAMQYLSVGFDFVVGAAGMKHMGRGEVGMGAFGGSTQEIFFWCEWAAVSGASGAFAQGPYGVAAGAYHSCSLYPSVYQQNTYKFYSITVLTGMSLVANSLVFCQGRNTENQIGTPVNNNNGQFRGPEILHPSRPNTQWNRVVAGHYHTCAVDTNGRMWCMGRNTEGQLGTYYNNARFTSPPTLATVMTSLNSPMFVTSPVAAGGYHTCAMSRVQTFDRLYCWGDNTYGQLGLGYSGAPVQFPTAVPGIYNVVALTLGEYHTCVKMNYVSLSPVTCWGRNNHGQLGDGTYVDRNISPIQIPELLAG